MIIENAYPTRDLQYVRPLSRRVPSRPTRNFSLPTNSLPPPALPSPGLGLVPSDTPFEFLYDQSGSLIGSRPALSPNTLGQYVQVVGQSLHQWDLADPPTFPQQLVLPKDCRLVQTQPFPIDSGPMITPAPRESHQIASIQRSEIAVHPIIANGSEESSSDRRRSSRTPSSSRDGGRIEEIAKASGKSSLSNGLSLSNKYTVAPSHIEEVVPGSSSRSTHHHPSSHRDRGLSRSRASGKIVLLSCDPKILTCQFLVDQTAIEAKKQAASLDILIHPHPDEILVKILVVVGRGIPTPVLTHHH